MLAILLCTRITDHLHRYGYQGSEMDNEVSGNGNSYTTEFRQLDPRLGRWFSPDPVFQPWQSPYTSMDNNPIGLTDVRGDVAGECESCKNAERQGSTSTVDEDGEVWSRSFSQADGFGVWTLQKPADVKNNKQEASSSEEKKVGADKEQSTNPSDKGVTSTSSTPDFCKDCKESDLGPGMKSKKIAIDAGHGIQGSNNKYQDPGAIAKTGEKESDLTLAIADAVNKYLQEYNQTTTMIRKEELKVEGNSLQYRTNKAKEEGADIFISIHINAAGNKEASGFSVLYKSGGSSATENKKLAESIVLNQNTMQIRGGGSVVRNDLSVLNHFSGIGPAVLIEVGFLTNTTDLHLMKNSADQIGREIANGIFYYINGVVPNPSPPTQPTTPSYIPK